MAKNGEYTPTEQRIIKMLSDGQPHTSLELRSCLVDELGGALNVRVHISKIRKKLRPIGEDIVCMIITRSELAYRHIKMLVPPQPNKPESLRGDLASTPGVIRIR